MAEPCCSGAPDVVKLDVSAPGVARGEVVNPRPRATAPLVDVQVRGNLAHARVHRDGCPAGSCHPKGWYPSSSCCASCLPCAGARWPDKVRLPHYAFAGGAKRGDRLATPAVATIGAARCGARVEGKDLQRARRSHVDRRRAMSLRPGIVTATNSDTDGREEMARSNVPLHLSNDQYSRAVRKETLGSHTTRSLRRSWMGTTRRCFAASCTCRAEPHGWLQSCQWCTSWAARTFASPPGRVHAVCAKVYALTAHARSVDHLPARPASRRARRASLRRRWASSSRLFVGQVEWLFVVRGAWNPNLPRLPERASSSCPDELWLAPSISLRDFLSVCCPLLNRQHPSSDMSMQA